MAATSENNLVDIGRDLTREQRSLTVTDLDKEVLESGHFKSDQIKESQLYREVFVCLFVLAIAQLTAISQRHLCSSHIARLALPLCYCFSILQILSVIFLYTWRATRCV